MQNFKLTYASSGKLDTIHLNRGSRENPMWASLPFDPATKTFNPQSETEAGLLAEAQSLPEWTLLDLSDRAPDPPAPQTSDWNGLLAKLRATPIYLKAMQTSAPNAWAVLLFALGTSHDVNDLQHALQMVRDGLHEDFTAEEVGQINQFLAECNIGVQIT